MKNNMKNNWIVGAYAASPTRFGWLPEEEDAFLRGIYRLPNLRGLEVPFSESLHKFDETWFLHHLPKDLDIVITLIAGTTARVKKDPGFGLASNDEIGRKKAVDFVISARDAIERAHQIMERPSVIAVQIHSAPGREINGESTSAFARSLTELSHVDWLGAKLVVEHCDTQVPDQISEKGYLPIADELAAIKASGTDVEMSINWGRSTIEARSTQGPINHVRLCREAGVLAGVMFSGAANEENRFGTAWKDCHVPPAPLATSRGHRELLEPLSLMTSGEIQKTLLECALDEFDGYLGVKIAPLHEVTIEERIETVLQSLNVLEDAYAKAQL